MTEPIQNGATSERAAAGTPAEPTDTAPDGAETADVDQADAPADDAEDQAAATDSSKAGRDAAKYRQQLRAAEAERDQLRGALDAQQRAIIDRHAGTAGPNRAAVAPELLDAAGLNVADMLDDDGRVDLDAVEAFAATTAERFGIRPHGFTPDRGQGQSGAVSVTKPSLASAFRR